MPVHANARCVKMVLVKKQAKIINRFIVFGFWLMIRFVGFVFLFAVIKSYAKVKNRRKKLFICIYAKKIVPLQTI